MNLNELMRKAEDCDDRLQARSEDADEAYCALADEVEENMAFDDLLEAMVDLPDSVKSKRYMMLPRLNPPICLLKPMSAFY